MKVEKKNTWVVTLTDKEVQQVNEEYLLLDANSFPFLEELLVEFVEHPDD